MNLDSLNIFLHLSESLHFGKTSNACHLSPSAISRQIKRLEDEVGEKLFERDNRSVELTPAGFSFQNFARDVLNRYSELRIQLQQENESMRGEISLYASVTACYVLLPKLIRDYRRSYPGVNLMLQTGAPGTALHMVLDDKADISIIARPEKLPEGILFKKLMETSLVLITGKNRSRFWPLLEMNPVPWAQIPLVLAQEGVARTRVDAWFRKMGIRPNIYANVSGNEAILALAGLGCGVGVIPRVVVEKSMQEDSIRILDIEHPLDKYEVGLCVKKRKLLVRQVAAFWGLAPQNRPI